MLPRGNGQTLESEHQRFLYRRYTAIFGLGVLATGGTVLILPQAWGMWLLLAFVPPFVTLILGTKHLARWQRLENAERSRTGIRAKNAIAQWVFNDHPFKAAGVVLLLVVPVAFWCSLVLTERQLLIVRNTGMLVMLIGSLVVLVMRAVIRSRH